MKKMKKQFLYLLLSATVLLAACSDSDNDVNGEGTDRQTAVDAGPAYADKSLPVNRDGSAYGQAAVRYYSDKPSVAYISVADFYKLMTGGETMSVERRGDLYELTARGVTATVDVKADNLYSSAYDGFVNLMWMVDPDIAPNASYDGSKYLKVVKSETVSMFKPATGVRLDFQKYDIDLHDDGTTVFFPFATLSDIYNDCTFHYAACYDDKVVVNTKDAFYGINQIDPDNAAKPYQQTEVTADMAKYRYQELCFVFDHFFGFPGRSIMEQNGLAEKGFDATLDVVQNGKVVKRLLQSANNMDFAWGMQGLQYLISDGGHTNVRAGIGIPEHIESDYQKRLSAAAANYPEAAAMYREWDKSMDERDETENKLKTMRQQAYGDVLYKANSDKTTGVIIMNSFLNMDNDAWDKYYASAKTDADWQELMKSKEKDNFIGFLYGLQQAKADGVKNLILDLSQNNGGSDDIVAADVAILRKNRTIQSWGQNVLEGKNTILTKYVDANFDGVFDEKDDSDPKFDCSGMNIGVLSSKLAFSCGNLFPTLMKDYGFPIMGERSGGGACAIQVMITPDGFHYIISSYRDRSTDKNFVNNDTGIAPTDGFAFDYSHFYDLDFLTNILLPLP